MIKRVVWSDEARADNVKQVHGFKPLCYRFQVGDCIIFRLPGDHSIEVIRVKNRREACR